MFGKSLKRKIARWRVWYESNYVTLLSSGSAILKCKFSDRILTNQTESLCQEVWLKMAAQGFDFYRSHCSAVKSTFARLFASVPENFSVRKDGNRVYFLGAMALSGNSLFSVETGEAEGARKWKTVNKETF